MTAPNKVGICPLTTMEASKQPFVTIIMPIRNEREYIEASVTSALTADYPLGCFELLAIDGMSDDGTRDLLARLAEQHSMIRFIDNPERRQAHALNLGIRLARGEIIVRMDAHTIYPADYVQRCVNTLIETGADNVGGVCTTTPGAQTATGRAIALAMCHVFGVGNARFRTGVKQRHWVDTVPFGCWRKETLTRLGGFTVDLPYAEDDELNARLQQLNGRILLDPTIQAQYVARATLPKLALMLFRYGHDKPLAARRVGRITTVRQLVPSAFVLALGSGAMLSLITPSAWLVVVGLLSAHLATGFVVGLRDPGFRDLAISLRLPLIFIVMHLAYGVGYLYGASKLLLRACHSPTFPGANQKGTSLE